MPKMTPAEYREYQAYLAAQDDDEPEEGEEEEPEEGEEEEPEEGEESGAHSGGGGFCAHCGSARKAPVKKAPAKAGVKKAPAKAPVKKAPVKAGVKKAGATATDPSPPRTRRMFT